MSNVNCLNYTDPQAQAEALASRVAADLSLRLTSQSTVTLCVPGGTTPQLFFNALSQCELDWSRVRVLLNDERWVSLDDPLSNEALLQQHLQRNRAKTAQIISLYDATLPLDDAIATFNQQLARWLPLDVCVLGMGDDGHTASLFPGTDGLSLALDQQQMPALIVVQVPGKKELRVSLNLSALLTANQHYLLIKGDAKKNKLEQAQKNISMHLPISHLISACSVSVYYST